MYRIKGTNLVCFRSYLTNREQYISVTHDHERYNKNICCGVPQGSILRLLFFLLYVNDLHNSSTLDPIFFVDDAHLFYEHKDLKTLFSLVNQELQKINEWFEANKLSLNIAKARYSLFHKPNRNNGLSLLLPRLLTKKHKVERVKSIKFLGIKIYLGKIILSILAIKSPKTLVYYISSKYLHYTTRIFILIYIMQIYRVGQYKQNKSKKPTQSTKACSTNYQQ